jgi:predicted Zn-dependent protease
VLGRALVARGTIDEGIRELEEAERLDPDVRDTYLALALAYAQAGRPEGVTRARARLIELDARRGAR